MKHGFLVCAHPAKFNDAKKAIKKEIDIPKELSNLFDKEEKDDYIS